MIAEEFPIEQLVPHTGDMVLLDRVLRAEGDSIVAELTVRDDGLFTDASGRVPAWVGIEYMAQTVAAFAGYHAKTKNQAVKLGFLLGTRRYDSKMSFFEVGTKLQVSALKVLGEDDGLGSFDCTINVLSEGGKALSEDDELQKELVVSARITVYQPENIDEYLI